MELTIARSSPSKAFRRLDLPTLRRPNSPMWRRRLRGAVCMAQASRSYGSGVVRPGRRRSRRPTPGRVIRPLDYHYRKQPLSDVTGGGTQGNGAQASIGILFDYGGDDTYLFGRGDGQDLVTGNPNDGRTTRVDTLQLKPGVAPGDIVLSQVYDNYWGGIHALKVSIAGTDDSITINGFTSLMEDNKNRAVFAKLGG